MRLLFRQANCFSKIPQWATLDPRQVSPTNPHTICNILDGKVIKSSKTEPVVDPLNGGNFIFNSLPESQKDLDAYVTSQKNVPAWGMHNPIRNVHRYMQMGDIFMKIAA